MDGEDNGLHEKLKALGLEEVRRLRAKGVYGERNRPIVDEWIESQERKLSEEARERDFALREAEPGRKTRNKASPAVIVLAMAATISAICAVMALFL